MADTTRQDTDRLFGAGAYDRLLNAMAVGMETAGVGSEIRDGSDRMSYCMRRAKQSLHVAMNPFDRKRQTFTGVRVAHELVMKYAAKEGMNATGSPPYFDRWLRDKGEDQAHYNEVADKREQDKHTRRIQKNRKAMQAKYPPSYRSGQDSVQVEQAERREKLRPVPIHVPTTDADREEALQRLQRKAR